MRAVGMPGAGERRRVGEQQDVPGPPRGLAHTIEQLPPLACRRGMMAKHDARATWQRGDGLVEVDDPLVGHQPHSGQRGVASSHRGSYSAAMTPHEADAAERLSTVRTTMAAAATRAGRVADATLIAVSKTQGPEAIAPLIAAGQRVFGENRVQEAAAKWPALQAATPGIELHLVGQLQSNKAADAVAVFDAIHSVDRSSLVTALARAIERSGRRPTCFIQVDLADEPQKGGCPVAALPALLAEARAVDLPVAGLMCVPPAALEPAPWFALLAKLARDHGLSGLSMGMSGDYATAITLGATHVRVGTALFGARA